MNSSEFFGGLPNAKQRLPDPHLKGPKETGQRIQFFSWLSIMYSSAVTLPLLFMFSFFVGFVVYPLNINEARESDCSFLHSHFGSVSRPKLKLFMRLLRKFFHVPNFNVLLSLVIRFSLPQSFCFWRFSIESHDMQLVHHCGWLRSPSCKSTASQISIESVDSSTTTFTPA